MSISIPTNYINIPDRISDLKNNKIQGSTSSLKNSEFATVLENRYIPVGEKLDNIDTSAVAIELNEPQDSDDVCGLYNSLVDASVTTDFDEIYAQSQSKLGDVKKSLIKEADSELLSVQNDLINQATNSKYGPAAQKALDAMGIDRSDLTSETLLSSTIEKIENKDIEMLSLNYEELSVKAEDKIKELGVAGMDKLNTIVQAFSTISTTMISRFDSLKSTILNMDSCRVVSNLQDMQNYYKKTVESSTVTSIQELTNGDISLNDSSKIARAISNQLDTAEEIKAENAGSVNSSVEIMSDIYDAEQFVNTV